MFKDLFDRLLNKNQPSNENFYYGYYLFGKYGEPPIWSWTQWKKCLPLIQPVIDLSPQVPSILTSQSIPVLYGKSNQYANYDKGSLRFGKMIYNEANNEKWTSKYSNEKGWTFFDTEIVHPTFHFCEKNKVNPDIYIKISNENLTGNANAKINQALVILFKTKLVNKSKLALIEQNIDTLSDSLNIVLSGKILRPHIYKEEHGYFTDYLRDTNIGIVNWSTIDFSDRFKKYGMVTIKRLQPI